ncbi:MAG: RDD family protein, partial [Xanthomonadales bacterium]|nr:RDD family protein [Xanthomonadales bacterium]
GLVWVGIDEAKQGWHDKLARTVVLRKPPKMPKHFRED